MMAGPRIRTLADSVRDLTAEVQRVREAAPRVDLSKLDGKAVKAAERIAKALENFNIQLGVTNSRLESLAKRPIIGMLGGGAEAELHRLTEAADDLREELGGLVALVPR